MIDGSAKTAEARATAISEEMRRMAGSVPPDHVKIWVDEFHQLHVAANGQEYVDVRPVRIFPISSKADYVSFLDDKRKEVLLLRNPHKLDKGSRQALDAAFSHIYYCPKITRVDSVTESMGITRWEVMTDRGYAKFELTDRDHFRKLPGRRLIMQDPDGNRFEIEDLAKLDKKSLEIIQSEL
jgi:hypothetical protein